MNSLKNVTLSIAKAGRNKVHRPIVKTLILSIFGGFFVGLSAALSTICGYNLVEGYSQFYQGMVFPIGIIIVYCGGGELITGNMLLLVAMFSNKISALEMLLSWLIVLVGNFIGCLLIAILIVYSHTPNMFNVNLAYLIIVKGNERCGINFGEAFIQAIFANFFNCLGIWLAMIGKEMRSVLLGLFIPNFAIMSLGLAHCVADMYYILAGIFLSYEYGLDRTEMNWGKLFYKSIIPVFLGNLIGGGILVGVIFWYVFLDHEKNLDKNKIKTDKIFDSTKQRLENPQPDNINQNQNQDLSTLHFKNG